MIKQYETLLFDVDGTLLDFDKAEALSIRSVLRHYHLPETEEMVERYHVINVGCWQEYEKGSMSRDQVLVERFHRFFGSVGVEASAAEAEGIYRELLGNSAYLMDGALDVLSYLKEKNCYGMHIITNGVAATQKTRLKDSGLNAYFDRVFISEELDCQKPQKLFFDRVFEVLGPVDPAKTLVIGDSLTSDIKGAENAGLDACWYNPKRAENRQGIPVRYEIRDILELKRLL